MNEAKWSVTVTEIRAIIGDGFHRSSVCTAGVEKLAVNKAPADRDHIWDVDAVDNAERDAGFAAVCRRRCDRYADSLPAVRRRSSADASPAATDALPGHASAPEHGQISQRLDSRLHAKQHNCVASR